MKEGRDPASLEEALEALDDAGNAFWEKNRFTCREDLVYRNKALAEMVRIDM